MNKKLEALMFLTVFLVIFTLMNSYVLIKIFELFKIQSTVLYYILLFFLSISYIIISTILRYNNNLITRTSHVIIATLMGIIFLACTTFLFFDIIKMIPFWNFSNIDFFIIIGVLIISIYAIVNTLFLTIKIIDFETEKLFEEVKIVQLSDLHIGSTHKKDFLKKIVDKTNKLEPDIVLITGDLIDGPHKYNKGEFNELNNIKAPIYYSIGNHEYHAGLDKVYELLKNTKIKILRNEAVSLEKIQIIGIDDSEDKHQVDKQLKKIKIDKEKFVILMYHRPTGFKSASKDIDLMLSGHTHAGQIYPFNLITKMFVRPVKGLHKHNSAYLYVNPGTGWWGPPMRLGSRNEITVIKLRPREKFYN